MTSQEMSAALAAQAERIERLEGELAEMKAVLAGVCRTLEVDKPDHKRKLRAASFILVDVDGNERAALVATGSGPRLLLFDEEHNPRATLAIDEAGPRLWLYDGQVRPVCSIPQK